MKIPPRSMFISQLYGTVVGGFMNYWVLRLIISSKRQFLDGTMEDPTGQVSLKYFMFFFFNLKLTIRTF
jgi:hypothetical protein